MVLSVLESTHSDLCLFSFCTSFFLLLSLSPFRLVWWRLLFCFWLCFRFFFFISFICVRFGFILGGRIRPADKQLCYNVLSGTHSNCCWVWWRFVVKEGREDRARKNRNKVGSISLMSKKVQRGSKPSTTKKERKKEGRREREGEESKMVRHKSLV